MAKDDSYEIMPYKEVVELKKQIADLQNKVGDTSSKELLASMAALTKSMNSMLQLFSSAAEEMKLEEKTESELSGKISPLMEKVDRLDEQNRTIAEGLVAVADMLNDMRKGKGEKPEHRHSPPPTRRPEMFEEDSFSSGPPRRESEGFPPLGPPQRESFGPPDLPPLEPPEPTRPMYPPHSNSPRVVLRGPMPPPGMPPLGPPPDFDGFPPLDEDEPKKKGVLGLFKKR